MIVVNIELKLYNIHSCTVHIDTIVFYLTIQKLNDSSLLQTG
jgi:hypothetical protein